MEGGVGGDCRCGWGASQTAFGRSSGPYASAARRRSARSSAICNRANR